MVPGIRKRLTQPSSPETFFAPFYISSSLREIIAIREIYLMKVNQYDLKHNSEMI